MKKRAQTLSFILFACLLTACGYHIEQPTVSKTVMVPFAIGDQRGDFTNQLVYQLNATGRYRTVVAGGNSCLKVTLLSEKEDHIGYRYDRNQQGALLTTLIPTETRTSLLALVELTDATTGCYILPPAKLSASYDFDHDWYSGRDGVNVFSLGQVTDYSDAKEQAQLPLHQLLAQKIVDWMLQQ